MVFIAVRMLGISVPLAPVAAVIVLQLLVALLTWNRLTSTRPVTPFELFLHVHLDILALTAVLYLTGGTTNPFAPLFLLPLAVAASALEQRWVWLTALTTFCGYLAVRLFHIPMGHPEGSMELYELHENGMVVNYAFTAAMLAFFVSKIRLEFERHTKMLAQVHEREMRNESVVAMGALAASCAHELSSPLGTVAVVVTELQRERAGDPVLQENLQLVDDQIQVAKRVISNLTGAAGQRRAEAAGVARLDRFLHEIVERAQALHPGATLHARIGKGETAPHIVAEETLRQAFVNLIDNSVRVSPGHVEILADWSGSELVVQVWDEGPGFPKEVFGKLAKAVSTTDALHAAADVGLGLLLTNVTLSRFGGSLILKNISQRGACAEVRLPLHAILFQGSYVAGNHAASG